MNCPNQTRNSTACNCTYQGCPKHGICCECIAYHRKNGELPACYFTAEQEATWDRSKEHYVRACSK